MTKLLYMYIYTVTYRGLNHSETVYSYPTHLVTIVCMLFSYYVMSILYSGKFSLVRIFA